MLFKREKKSNISTQRHTATVIWLIDFQIAGGTAGRLGHQLVTCVAVDVRRCTSVAPNEEFLLN